MQETILNVVAMTAAAAEKLAHLTDKEVGLRLAELPPDVRRLIFPFRTNGGKLLEGRTREVIFRMVRPTGNQLAGYRPSYAINRVLEEVG